MMQPAVMEPQDLCGLKNQVEDTFKTRKWEEREGRSYTKKNKHLTVIIKEFVSIIVER